MKEYGSKKRKGWILKLDIEKAFDFVDWNFLEWILKAKKFDSLLIKWALGYIRDPKFLYSSMVALEVELWLLEESYKGILYLLSCVF